MGYGTNTTGNAIAPEILDPLATILPSIVVTKGHLSADHDL